MKHLWLGGRMAQLALVFAVCAFFFVPPAFCAKDGAEKVESLGDIAPEQANAIIARLSDEEVRRLVLAGLAKPAEATTPTATGGGLNKQLRQWLHALDHERDAEAGIARLMTAYPRLPGELVKALGTIGGGKAWPLIGNLLLLLLIFLIAGIAEWYVRRLAGRIEGHLPESKESRPGSHLWGGLLQLLPEIVGLAVFGFTALLVFLFLDTDTLAARTAFMAVLLAILLARALSLLAYLLCWPTNAALRVLPMEDALADSMYRGIRFLIWYVSCAMVFHNLVHELGVSKPVHLALGSLFGTVLIILVTVRMMTRKGEITTALLVSPEGGKVSWSRRQLATFWPLLALLYLFLVWLFWISTLGSGRDNGALFVSLLIVPIYLLLDRIGRWLIGNIISSLGFRRVGAEERKKRDEQGEGYLSPEEREQRLREVMTRVFRWFVLLVLAVWLMYLWGVEILLAGAIVKAAFDILITLTLALFIWRFSSRFIERKLAAMEVGQEVKEIHDDEFGTTVQRGRSYTLLPLLRKFIASTLLVMVALIILSSIGVEIGPLLAGAGVVGLAIGFGAQKMVSDILSGLFYLLDDAFRVGEYIMAGSISGTVEAITLRNVMLRHHRGMLQIVPHSDLGSITNFMRGGIIVKFNLEFPYDVDVEKVRKIIKKVGQAMLEDKDLGPDFILPLKSQGVSEITNSIMIIRVKFTAHPGRQFVIRREAFRRITEALAAKGIHYAHRKVIVEVPQTEGRQPAAEEVGKAAGAGATGSLDPLSGQEKAPAKGAPEGMPGM